MEKWNTLQYWIINIFPPMFCLCFYAYHMLDINPNRRTDLTCWPTRLTPWRTSTMCTSSTCRRWRGHSVSPCPRGWVRCYVPCTMYTVCSICSIYSSYLVARYGEVFLIIRPLNQQRFCSDPSDSTVPLFFLFIRFRSATFLLYYPSDSVQALQYISSISSSF